MFLEISEAELADLDDIGRTSWDAITRWEIGEAVRFNVTERSEDEVCAALTKRAKLRLPPGCRFEVRMYVPDPEPAGTPVKYNYGRDTRPSEPNRRHMAWIADDRLNNNSIRRDSDPAITGFVVLAKDVA